MLIQSAWFSLPNPPAIAAATRGEAQVSLIAAPLRLAASRNPSITAIQDVAFARLQLLRQIVAYAHLLDRMQLRLQEVRVPLFVHDHAFE